MLSGEVYTNRKSGKQAVIVEVNDKSKMVIFEVEGKPKSTTISNFGKSYRKVEVDSISTEEENTEQEVVQEETSAIIPEPEENIELEEIEEEVLKSEPVIEEVQEQQKEKVVEDAKITRTRKKKIGHTFEHPEGTPMRIAANFLDNHAIPYTGQSKKYIGVYKELSGNSIMAIYARKTRIRIYFDDDVLTTFKDIDVNLYDISSSADSHFNTAIYVNTENIDSVLSILLS